MAESHHQILGLIFVINLLTIQLQFQLSYATGSNDTGDSNFQILLGDVELGQRPELFKVAALEDVHVIVSDIDEQQTAVVANGVNIRLDWSRWVNQTLTDSVRNATYIFRRTQLNESGDAIESAQDLLELSDQSERIDVRVNQEENEFYVQITCVIVSGQNDSDWAIYELEACLRKFGSRREVCFNSSITVYGIKRPDPLQLECFSGLIGGSTTVSCRSKNNPLVSRTCTISGVGVHAMIPCNDSATITVRISDFRYGPYTLTVNGTDVYGQTATIDVRIYISVPQLNGGCCFDVSGLNIYCMTSLDNFMVAVTFNCSYDQGPSESCGRNISINKRSFTKGIHQLEVTFISEDGQIFSVFMGFNIKVFELECRVDESRPRTIYCVGVNGIIDEVSCVYDEEVGPGAVREMCELPVVIDYTHFDQAGGYHNVTVIANSTIGEVAEFTHTILLSHIECVQLTEPGRTVVVCGLRVNLIDEPLCVFPNLIQSVPCNNLSSIVITASDYPLQIGEDELFVSGNYYNGVDPEPIRARVIIPVNISEEQMVECSTTVNCSSNGTLMSARRCCVNSVDGLAYTIPGREDECHTCIVFGWHRTSYSGSEQESAHTLLAGYLKGADQTRFDLTLNVMITFGTASASDVSRLINNSVRIHDSGEADTVSLFFLNDGVIREENETLSLKLIPLPSTLQTMPNGEAVFFMNSMELTIEDTDKIPQLNTALIGSCVGVGSFLIGIVLVLICVYYYYYRKKKRQKFCSKVTKAIEDINQYALANQCEQQKEISVHSSYKLDLPPHLIIPSSNIQLNETIGQGEFGIVYKGYVAKGPRHSFDEYLAIKTLKGFYDHSSVREMLKECSRMSKFNHPNVLTLKGVCLDGGPAPYIIMPFMANGSLLAYLKGNRKNLIVSSANDKDDVEHVSKQLIDMCIQVAKGMEYLASVKVVHRDLAARNCMIDANFVIKVADFGLSESIGVKEYFRQDEDSSIKLPLKWLPPESISDYIFSEKSDVWAYGITCWEIFSGGKVPYSELNVRDIPKQLAHGHRLEKPINEACSDEIYSFMHQCWLFEPERRPNFSQLVVALSQMLEGMAGYIDVGAFGVRTSVFQPPVSENLNIVE